MLFFFFFAAVRLHAKQRPYSPSWGAMTTLTPFFADLPVSRTSRLPPIIIIIKEARSVKPCDVRIKRLNRYSNKNIKIRFITTIYWTVTRDCLVVRTLRCGCSNPDSNPGQGRQTFFFSEIYFEEKCVHGFKINKNKKGHQG